VRRGTPFGSGISTVQTLNVRNSGFSDADMEDLDFIARYGTIAR